MRLSRPWPPHHIRLPLHPRVWREDRQIAKARYTKPLTVEQAIS